MLLNTKDFLERISELLDNKLTQEEQECLEQLKNEYCNKGGITEKGQQILLIMQSNYDNYKNIFDAKQLAELLMIPARSISGSMKKLVLDNYVTKTGTKPVKYSLTDLGKNVQFDN